MKKELNLIFIVLLLSSCNLHLNATTYQADTARVNNIFKESLIPVGLIGLGVVISNSEFEKRLHTNIRSRVGNDFEVKIDDYLAFAPIVEMYSADVLGIPAKNHWFDQSKYLFFSNVVSSTISISLKGITKKIRPNGEMYSFPSGHTTVAFTNAAVLYQSTLKMFIIAL